MSEVSILLAPVFTCFWLNPSLKSLVMLDHSPVDWHDAYMPLDTDTGPLFPLPPAHTLFLLTKSIEQETAHLGAARPGP